MISFNDIFLFADIEILTKPNAFIFALYKTVSCINAEIALQIARFNISVVNEFVYKTFGRFFIKQSKIKLT